jgi:membrane AbrB-like protein
MSKVPAVRTVITLAIGFAGAVVAVYLGLPAGALLGSTLAVFLASCFRVTGAVPTSFRTVAFSAIGCSLGSGLTRNFFGQAMQWPLSLLILTLSVVVIILFCSWLLMKFYRQSAVTAILSTAPGALAYTLSITAEGFGDARSIVIIQSIRVLGLIIVLPLILDQLSGSPAGPAGVPAPQAMAPAGFAILFLATLAAGRFFEKRRLPSAYLLTGTVISSIAHVSGLVSGRPAGAILFLGFAVTGTVVGSRFSSISLRDLRSLLKVSLVILFASTAISALCAELTSVLLSIPFGKVFVAYAPGAIEAMAAMALSLGYDPTFVAGHHLYRLGLLFILIPVLLRLAGSKIHT